MQPADPDRTADGIADPVPLDAPGAVETGFDKAAHANCAELLWQNQSRNPDKTALVGPLGSLTYRELIGLAARWGRTFLEAGLRRGERIAVFLDDTPAFAAAFYGAVRAGLVPVLLNTQTRPDALNFFLQDSGARLALVEADLAGAFGPEATTGTRLETIVIANGRAAIPGARSAEEFLGAAVRLLEAAETGPDDMAFWMYSSGSTGRPKGIVHLHHDVAYIQAAFGSRILKLRDNDICYSVPKAFFAYGFGNSLVFPFACGATTLLMPGQPRPEIVLGAIETHRPTVLFGLPTLHTALARSPEIDSRDLSSLRQSMSAAEILPEGVCSAWKARAGHGPTEGLGSTELLHVYLSNRLDDHRLGAAGARVPGYEIRLETPDGTPAAPGEEGVMFVRGQSSAPLYWNRPDTTRETMRGDWIHTGDRFIEKDGYYYFQGRAADLVKVSGQWVWPLEVERCLNEHPEVHECAVLAEQMEDKRMALRAVVALVPGQSGDADQSARLAELPERFDYVVVGSGSAGCALVGTLAEKTDGNILLIEAGDWDAAPSVDDPRIWFTNLGTERDWVDVAIPSAGVNGRAIPEHTGRVVGGGSSINATIWARPTKADMDHSAEVSGDASWNYETCREIFKRIENWQGTPDAEFRGSGGPVWVQPAQGLLPLVGATLAAAAEVGLPVVDDLNTDREITGKGFGLMNQIIRDGRRNSMARAFLYPALARDNVTLLVNTAVNRMLVENGTAVGVECVRDGQTVRFNASREVVLSAGGFSTPKLLMLSGIGDEAQLATHGIPTVLNAPEVGRNVQDHILQGGCLFEGPEPIEHRNSAANMPGYMRTDDALELPDVSVVQIELPYASEVIAKEYPPKNPGNTWALCTGLVAPKSRGTVTLASADPAARPVVDMQFLSHPDDVKYLGRSIEIGRQIAAAPALKDHVVAEVAPGRKLEGDELVQFIRNGATTYFHASGACRMGSDDGAVVDAQLRVNGIRNLRICDSSISPRIVSVPTMPVCAMIGAKAADMISAG